MGNGCFVGSVWHFSCSSFGAHAHHAGVASNRLESSRANLQQVLTSYGSNLAQILSTVRFQANYKGTLVLVTTYQCGTGIE
jgi:hypothetical protein